MLMKGAKLSSETWARGEGGVMRKIKDEPHAKRRGWLKNNNSPGDFTRALRCGAKTRKGTVCKAPAMANGRCRLHGGKSTGPKTPEGLARSRQANWKHGFYSVEAVEERRFIRALLRENRDLIARMGG
ncbi:MAG: HGGxSTG domain-containing protein [Deltaproteobacteria bacterium]|nr:HGGxSTG domain-containing protein [Deltaproteobacteria bacterium]